MTYRVSKAALRRQTDNITVSARKLGLLGEDQTLDLQIGSPTYGTAYRLFATGGDIGTGARAFAGIPGGFGGGYVGWTAKEAETTLTAVEAVLYALIELRKDES